MSAARFRGQGRSAQAASRKQISVGMVGLGYWGPNLLRALFSQDQVDVRYVCDLDDDNLREATERYPSVRGTSDHDDLLGDEDLDAIVIATPVQTHFDLASKSLAAGKHTFVEKPLAPSSDEADSLLRQAEERGLMLMCGHTFIYSPAVQEVKRLIDTGELGDLHFISSSRVNLGLHQRDVSVVWDLAPHDFSILLYWLGQAPEKITATGRAAVVPGITDIAFLNLEFPSGLLASIELSWLAPSKLRRTVIVGSDKMVVYDDTSQEPVRVFDSGVNYRDPQTFGEYHLSYRTGDIVSPRLENWEPITVELADFFQAIRCGTEVIGNAEIARNVVNMIEAAETSLSSGGMPIETQPRKVLAPAAA
jgi:predicted dehydrogenase